MKLPDLLMSICFALMLVMAIVQNALWILLFRKLEKDFHEEWLTLGKPSFKMNSSLNNHLSAMSFLWKRKYVLLGNADLSRQSSIVRAFSAFSFIAGAIWVVAVLVFIMLNPIN